MQNETIPDGCHACGALPCDWVDNPGWRPIETAPRDGWHAPILTCRMGDPAPWFGGEPVGGYAEPPEAAYWNEYGDCWTPCHRPHDEWLPTHWLPLPSAPTVGEGR